MPDYLSLYFEYQTALVYQSAGRDDQALNIFYKSRTFMK